MGYRGRSTSAHIPISEDLGTGGGILSTRKLEIKNVPAYPGRETAMRTQHCICHRKPIKCMGKAGGTDSSVLLSSWGKFSQRGTIRVTFMDGLRGEYRAEANWKEHCNQSSKGRKEWCVFREQ